jgi:hypothetical protein
LHFAVQYYKTVEVGRAWFLRDRVGLWHCTLGYCFMRDWKFHLRSQDYVGLGLWHY